MGDEVFDLQRCSAGLGMEPLPVSVMGLLASGRAPDLAHLAEALDGPEGGRLPAGCALEAGNVTLRAPVPRPPKLICLGLNYRDHAEEQNREVPKQPLIFAKATSAVIGPGEAIEIPEGSVEVDYEAELAFVIGRHTSRATPAEAEAAIFGYCCLNDVTEREMQFGERLWFRGKGVDTFAPMGPWIVTPDEVGDPLDLGITARVNSRLMQSSSTANLIFGPADIIAFISRTMTLVPGDVISTGTPAGVGVFREPQVFLKPGDVVEITIDRIGTLSNPVAAAS
jgi:2-keto-4-pentenoate hydratase/2-oxohepta-3-ene-1,7-dioic acid hydratase in catechol pathway